MKQIVITLLAICFVTTVNAQFLYKLEKREVKAKAVAPLSPMSVSGKITFDNLSVVAAIVGGTITSVDFTLNPKTDQSNDNSSTDYKAIGTGATFLLGTGNNESISAVEFLSGHLSSNQKDRLAFGGAFAKSDSKETSDIKTLLQGGGNFFLSYSYSIHSDVSPKNVENFWALIVRGKLGAILPNAGTSTNVIQASFDPGLELHFSLSTLDKNIGIRASVRSGVLWASKDFSDATGFNENLIPYSLITGGIKLKSLGTIVYSQSFLSKNLTGITQPKGSIGFSFTL